MTTELAILANKLAHAKKNKPQNLIGEIVFVNSLLEQLSLAVQQRTNWEKAFMIAQVEALTEEVRETVEIIRDGWGVPHIYAENDAAVNFSEEVQPSPSAP